MSSSVRSSPVRCVPLFVLAALAPTTAAAARLAVLEETCDLVPLGVTDVRGVTVVPTGYALVDIVDDAVTVINPSCALFSSFSTAAFGSTSPTGIAFDAANNRFLVVDDSVGMLYFTGISGNLLGSCGLWQSAIVPDGIAVDSSNDTFAIVDGNQHRAYIVDDTEMGGGACNVLTLFSTAAYTSDVHDVAYVSDEDRFAILDAGTFANNEVYLTTKTGGLADQFDIEAQPIGSNRGEGLGYRDDGRFVLVDDVDDRLSVIQASSTITNLCAAPTGDASGIAVNAAAGEILTVDRLTREVRVVTTGGCAPLRQFTVGGSAPSDIAYVPTLDLLAIADTVTMLVSFVNDTTGAVDHTCNAAAMGVDRPSGLAWVEGIDLLAILSDSGNDWILADTDCNVVMSRSANALKGNTIALNPVAIAARPETGVYVVGDDDGDELYVSNFEGVPEGHFDIAGGGLSCIQGLVSSPVASDALLAIDNCSDRIYQIQLGALSSPRSLSGRFSSANAEAHLFERGQGRFTGVMTFNGNPLPVFGEFEGATGTLYFGAVTPAGNPVAVEVSVSPDLNTIAMPNPIGTLTRDL